MILNLLYFWLITSVSPLYQSYAVQGRFICGMQSASAMSVKLFELDHFSPENDLLEKGLTDENGNFNLSGGTAELTRIEPMLEVVHDCNDGNKIGLRKSKFLLPHFYITNGRRAMKTYNIGLINLETVFIPEGRDYSDDTAQ